MKTILFSIIGAAMLFMVACSGNKAERTTRDYSDMLGMWVLQEPQRDGKWELMFNEDSTGFIFVDDAYRCGIAWQPGDSCIDLNFLFDQDGVKCTIPKKFRIAVDTDTLILQDIDSVGNVIVTERFIRFKQ